MAKQWKVNVQEEDFAFGEPNDSNRCAVQRAVTREIPGARRVEVDLQTIRFTVDGERHVFLTPWSVSDYVIAFDAGDRDELAPFSFTLQPSHAVGSKVRRQVFTEDGRKVDALRSRMRKAEARKVRAEAMVADPEATPSDRSHARATLEHIDDDIAERKAAYEAVSAEVTRSGKPRTRKVDSDAPRPPRKSKTRTRNFGARVYRVNQGEGRQHYVHGKVDVEAER